ncbi:capsular polysaccharide export protein, LipB/KpsS family [Phaeovulum vinaykumarii]|uniref:Capsule polysaccharide biosynthesis protein n=1 Tax=Phaeovulum vinaykumarii TaxID=407234 RepID=A0A1N7LMP0_9RHOB|nr:hypothetical protein [Phaeovulum vinaykumarii]SIS75108.1 Capsule polysaccharide biosynthesis protein [Phaeovulum vinaykumarii]SOC05521.1 capsular polysaccharide biosynthesis protein [Phaeovulum vinaykumarii]
MSGAARVVIHLPGRYLNDYEKPAHLALYPRLIRAIEARGGRAMVALREEAQTAGGTLPGDGDLHVVESGWVTGPGWLSAAVAYLPGYWHLGPDGILGDGPAGRRPCTPEEIPAAEALSTYARLRAQFARARRSRYKQARGREHLPRDAIAVCLQGNEPHRRGQAYLSNVEMLRAVIRAAGARPVLVKGHPLNPQVAGALLTQMAGEIAASGVRVHETSANIHDLLAQSAVNVSINSATALEGMLHGRPAIVCGRTDYAGLVETVRDPAEFPAALLRALSTPRDWARAVTWYFTRNCLWIEGPHFERDLLAVLSAAGFPPERLGLGPRRRG